MSVHTHPAEPTAATCSPAQRLTRSLLGYGVVAGPFYVVISVAQALTHPGFDLTRHSWSQLAAGPYGWIQMANLVLTGAMVVTFAVGVGRSLPSRWAPRLLALYGLGLIASGFLVADPAGGYPVGLPAPVVPTWHSLGHLVAGALGFAALIAATFVLARTFTRQGARALAWWSRLTGLTFAAAFVGIASGSSSPAIVLPFVAAVIAVWVWLAGVALHLYRRVSATA